MRTRYINGYFNWLCSLLRSDSYPYNAYRFQFLLYELYSIEFTWSIRTDYNRAYDGLKLREEYAELNGMDYARICDAPCSVLEMMVALARRCEEDIMQNSEEGDRTYMWFWIMIDNLGLLDMTDDVYDKDQTDAIIQNFLNRNYAYNGRGSIFWVQHPRKDFRTTDLWYQMSWYLESQKI